MIIYSKEMEFGKRVTFMDILVYTKSIVWRTANYWTSPYVLKRSPDVDLYLLNLMENICIEEMLQTTIPINTSSRLPKNSGPLPDSDA
jgi:hypothetical protein